MMMVHASKCPRPLLGCPLQIVLWTACLAANGGAIEGHKYLQRETVSVDDCDQPLSDSSAENHTAPSQAVAAHTLTPQL